MRRGIAHPDLSGTHTRRPTHAICREKQVQHSHAVSNCAAHPQRHPLRQFLLHAVIGYLPIHAPSACRQRPLWAVETKHVRTTTYSCVHQPPAATVTPLPHAMTGPAVAHSAAV